MKIDKKLIFTIMSMIVFTIVMFTVFQKFDMIAEWVDYVLKLLNPLIIGLSMAFVLNIPMSFLEKTILKRLKKLKRPLGLTITYVAVIGIIFLISFLIIPEIGNTGRTIKNNFPSYINSIKDWIISTLDRFDISIDNLSQISINWDTISSAVIDFLTKGSGEFFNTTVGITSSIVSGVVDTFLSLIISVYILVQKEKIGRQTVRVLTAFLPDRIYAKIYEIASVTSATFTKFISGQITEAFILGTLCFIGMLILSMPYSLLISVLIAVTALIPVFGAFIGMFVGAFLILMSEPIKALWFLIFITILQQLEGNIIYPKVVGDSVGISGLWVLIAVLIGGSLGGAVGILVSIPLCSVLLSLFDEYIDYIHERKAKSKE